MIMLYDIVRGGILPYPGTPHQFQNFVTLVCRRAVVRGICYNIVVMV